jgi:hypothetical protein
MNLFDEINKRIKEEIENDPQGVGYKGKTDEEIMTLLNTPVDKDRIVTDRSPAPICRILAGLENGPNVIKAEDVTTAKAFDIAAAEAAATEIK